MTKSRPDLVIVDIALGEADAVDVIRALERIKYKGRVLLISGRAAEVLAEVEQIGVRHGLCMLRPLRKPLHIHELAAVLKTVDCPVLLPHPKPSVPPQAGLSVKVDFKEAVHNGWFEVWYQPKIDLKSLSVCGAEALARVRHPEHGIVLPAFFLPAAGDPLHRILGQLVLQRAMLDWPVFAEARLALRLAVNMPISVIRNPDFVHLVRRLLPKQERFPGLIIEVTEDEVIAEVEIVREVATQLRLHNVFMSIDDFGSGYASLSRLTDMPFSELKLEGKYVRGCASHRLQRSLCQTVVDLGHGFGATVCAEGVEDAADLRALIGMGCDVAQGFVFARPMPADHFVRFLTSAQPAQAQADACMHDGAPPHDEGKRAAV